MTQDRPPASTGAPGADLSGVVLGVRDIVKVFGQTVALDGVSMDVRHGESMALLGANGAGKSSLVRILSGAVNPDEGEVVIDGHVVVLKGVHDARARGIGFVPQELTVAPDLTVAENVLAAGWPSRQGLVQRREGSETAVAACARVGLAVHPDQLVGDLGPAERRLLMIARGLLAEPRILILDEPTAALGEREAERMVEVLTLLREQELSMIYISHRMEEISRLCDSVTVLRNGKVVMRDQATETTVRRAVEVGMASSHHQDEGVDASKRAQSVATSGSALRCRDLRNGVLRGVSVEVQRGQIVGVAGLLGSGRSELLRALAGADPVDSGDIDVLGKPLRAHSPREAIAAGVALIPEDRRNQGGLPALTVQENLVMPAIPARGGWLRRREERRIAVAAIERFGIRCPSPDVPLRTLSGGNQQKVILARWLLTEPAVLLLDEPTAGIDVVAKGELLDLVRAAVSGGSAAIVVSSELDELTDLCDRIYVLRDGEVRHVVDGSTSVSELARLCGESRVPMAS